jgi:transcription elongation factor GreA
VSATPTEIADDGLLITADGYERLRAELDWLRNDGRRELEERLRDARLDGDVVDNPALLEVLEESAQLERRIAVLEDQLAQVRVVTPRRDGVAGLGTRVQVRDVETGEIAEYELVGALEADVGNGRVSVAAPVGKALVGRRKGDVVEVETPRGSLALEVLRVRAAAEGRLEQVA